MLPVLPSRTRSTAGSQQPEHSQQHKVRSGSTGWRSAQNAAVHDTEWACSFHVATCMFHVGESVSSNCCGDSITNTSKPLSHCCCQIATFAELSAHLPGLVDSILCTHIIPACVQCRHQDLRKVQYNTPGSLTAGKPFCCMSSCLHGTCLFIFLISTFHESRNE